MNEVVSELTYKLKEELKNSIEYKQLKQFEKELENNKDIQLLVYKKDMLIVKLEDILKYKDKNSVEVLMIQKEINDCLTNINTFEIVKKYNKALSEFNALLDKINKVILSF
ncbi:MAG: YlbF family regulator [Candidatus Onthovivens sp.]|nr:YlbF family regulator [Candidatus Onthovivens sp.]